MMTTRRYLLTVLGLICILQARIQCQSELDERLSSLNEQLNRFRPYELLSNYLAEEKPISWDFKANVKTARELVGLQNFDELIGNDEFKELARLFASLDESPENLCSGTNLANLRQMAAKMKQHNRKPTEGREAKSRLNRLVIEFGQRVFGACLEPLQDEWSEVDFGMVLIDETSIDALKTIETELDFMQVVKDDYNPNLANQYVFSRDIRRILEQLHEKRTGEQQAIVKSRNPVELGNYLDYYLVTSCKKMMADLERQTDGHNQAIVNKYLDLVTMAILMEPQVIRSKEEAFNLKQLKGTGRMMICNKLLAENARDALITKMVTVAKTSGR